MITLDKNPVIADPAEPTIVCLAQTRDTLLDTDIYSRFIYSCENNFRRSQFYKGYKDHLMRLGFYRDQDMATLTSDMATIELHHNFPTLKQGTIMISEHLLNAKGCVTTFEVVKALEEAHRDNEFAVIFLSKSRHQVFEDDPSEFISLNQCIGNPFKFIDHYIDGMTLEISYKLLLHLKQEEQYNGQSFSPNMMRLRDEILDWSQTIQF